MVCVSYAADAVWRTFACGESGAASQAGNNPHGNTTQDAIYFSASARDWRQGEPASAKVSSNSGGKNKTHTHAGARRASAAPECP